MDQAYINELNQAYDVFFSQPKWQGRLLVLDTDDLNIIARADDLRLVTNRIREALRLAPYQESLPLGN